MLRRFQAEGALLARRNSRGFSRIVPMLPIGGGETTMRWKISHHGHDPRQIDLLAVIALVILIVAAYSYLEDHTAPPSSNTAFIEPSQSVRW
jgi:hypothetical protein